jgi:hypothetical protein
VIRRHCGATVDQIAIKASAIAPENTAIATKPDMFASQMRTLLLLTG